MDQGNGNLVIVGTPITLAGWSHTRHTSALALHHRVLPPTLNADAPDPKLGLDETPFYLSTDVRPWIRSSDPTLPAGE